MGGMFFIFISPFPCAPTTKPSSTRRSLPRPCRLTVSLPHHLVASSTSPNSLLRAATICSAPPIVFSISLSPHRLLYLSLSPPIVFSISHLQCLLPISHLSE
ncbi:hypothetical protein ACLOJK_005362, partial [Asimina triloba]